MLHELWDECDDVQTLCLAGPRGRDEARALLGPNARLAWTVEGASHFEAVGPADHDLSPNGPDHDGVAYCDPFRLMLGFATRADREGRGTLQRESDAQEANAGQPSGRAKPQLGQSFTGAVHNWPDTGR